MAEANLRFPDRPLELYLVRHGQTDYNLRRIVQGGGVDSSLNNTGRQQADALFNALQDVPFQQVYTSALKRTQETLAPFASQGHNLQARSALNELNWGEAEGQKASPELRQQFYDVISAWQQGDVDRSFPRGESAQEGWNRSAAFFQELADAAPEGPVLVCAHGRILRIMLSQLFGYGLSRMEVFRHQNTGINHLVLHHPRIWARRLNDTRHLATLDFHTPSVAPSLTGR